MMAQADWLHWHRFPPQVVDVRSRKKSAYVHIKMPALLMLKYMSKVGSEGGGLHGGS